MVCGSTRSVFHTRSRYNNEDDDGSLSLFSAQVCISEMVFVEIVRLYLS